MKTELTRREKEILIGVTAGMTNREIAETLFVSMETVQTHCRHIHKKVGDKWPRPKRRSSGLDGKQYHEFPKVDKWPSE